MKELEGEENREDAQHAAVYCDASPEDKTHKVPTLFQEVCLPRIHVVHFLAQANVLLRKRL